MLDRQPVARKNIQDWLPPPPDCLKLNTGIASRRNSKSFAFAAVVKDDKGKVIVARSKTMSGSFCFVTRNFLALRGGLLLAEFYNIQVKIAEVDSLNIVSVLNSSAGYLGDASFIVNDIKILFSEVGIGKCQASPKSGSSLSLNLASLPLSSSKKLLWLDNSPFCMPFML
ncbi:hypothetical protein LWI28_017581 [Acer negundo]|uniref:RNase H type-1 domain-containing protein n=1 Tax=Acer negundo TaxID=4023 RepID=A0AAD5JRG6_ACENE|nr:hypothetical protein LWI28_017581 [Acer negundo]